MNQVSQGKLRSPATAPAAPPKLPLVRNRYLFFADLLLIPFAVGISFLLRLEIAGLAPYWRTIVVYVVLAELVKPPIFYFFGFYRRVWRYASTRELVTIVVATLTGTALVALLTYSLASLVWSFRPLPRSIPFIDWLVSLTLVGGIRFAVKLAADVNVRQFLRLSFVEGSRPQERRVLVMGAGDAGALIVREMQANPSLGFIPIGLLDDNRAKTGMEIHGVTVQGAHQDIPRLVQEQQVDEVIIAMPTAPGHAIRQVVALCRQAGVACRTMPGLYELISGDVSVTQVREVRIEDLLRREPVRIDPAQAAGCLSDAVVLVTGAGGSIGSELCRQIAPYRPRKLLLLGHGENSIYLILRELRARFPNLQAVPLIADIRDAQRLTEIMARHRPQILFHAAAHKHVPLMEVNVAEAVTNNVFGTLNLLQAAEAGGIKRIVLVSTDKAVNPVCIMGATKRVAELLVQDASRRTGSPYVVVRFGNVLGSRGSVVPLFQEQIAAGGPVTVTHPEMRRYFMIIPEAVQLIIQAAVTGQGSEVFVLDMGEPIRVVDLATDLIQLSGLTPGHDIEICFIGPRPGEKLNENLFADGERPCPTRHEKILVAQANHVWAHADLFRLLAELETLAREGDPARICAKLQEIVPEYRPLDVTGLAEQGLPDVSGHIER